jgi:hypothetical protein
MKGLDHTAQIMILTFEAIAAILVAQPAVVAPAEEPPSGRSPSSAALLLLETTRGPSPQAGHYQYLDHAKGHDMK